MVHRNQNPTNPFVGLRRLKLRQALISAIMALLLMALSLFQAPLLAEAAITPLGNEFTVNSTTANHQTSPVVASLPNGNFVVVWESRGQDVPGETFNGGIYLRIFNSAGVAQTAEVPVNVTTIRNQQRPAIAVNPSNGNFLISWENFIADGSTDSLGRLFNQSGTALSSEIPLASNIVSDQLDLDAAFNPLTGEFIVVFASFHNNNDYDTYFRRFTATGTPIDATDVAVTTDPNFFEYNPEVAVSPINGDFIVVYQNEPTSVGPFVYHTYYRHFNWAGVALDPSGIRLNSTPLDENEYLPEIVSDPAGNFLAVWNYDTPPTASIGIDVMARRINSSGDFAGAAFRVNSTADNTYNLVKVAMDPSGNYIVTWSANDASFDGIFARSFNSSDVAQDASPVAINQNTADIQFSPSVAINNTNVALLVWANSISGISDVSARRYDAGFPLASSTITQSGGNTAVTEGGATDSYTIVLGTAPTASVTIAVDPDAQCDIGAGPGNPVNLTFNPASAPLWSTPQTVTVTAVDDTIFEGPHNCVITHTPSSADANYNSLVINSVTATITDNDTQPTISISDVSVTEGNSGTVNAVFTVSLSNGSTQTITVNRVTANDTAIAPGDYTALTSSALTFSPGGSLTQNVTVVVNGDTIDEGTSEGFFVNLSGASNATISDNQGIGTITDDDDPPSISINDVTVTEGNSGTVNATFTVSLTSTSALDITVNYATANDTAVAPGDYTAVSSTPLTFTSGGALTQNVTVVVNGDMIDEGASESFFVNLSGATNATISDNQGVGTITDDDAAPTFSINDVTVTEGNSGTVNATFTVSLNSTATSNITVNYVTADGTATAPADYTAITTTGLTFTSGGALSQTVTVVVNGDTIDEGSSEQFLVNLSDAVNATISDGQGVGTITDDDNPPSLSINDVSVTEGDSGTVNATFTVSLSTASGLPITVNYVTADNTATAPADYTAISSTQLTFNPSDPLTQTVTVVVNGDTIDEGASETFFVNLSGATNASISDGQGVGTITDDDNAPVISINDVTVTEGNSGTVNATFTVSLSNGSSQTVSVNYATADGTAAAPADFTSITSTPLTFLSGGALTQTVTVVVSGDTIDEGASEQFAVNLSGAANATIGDSQGVGTITDDDDPPSISINDVTVTEGDSGTVNATFTVSLTSTSSSNITVNYATANDTATEPSDFATNSGTLTFLSGGTLSQTVTVVVNGDTIDEGASEQFFVNLSNPANATIADGQGVGTITDDDAEPVISINDVTVTEGDSGTVNATFTVSVTNTSASNITVNYATADDTAVAPSDYTAIVSTQLTFTPGGALSQTVTVVVNGDTIDEGASEQFFVNLSGATNASIGDAQGVGTITDDDNAPSISINDVTVTEGNAGTVNAVFTVTLSNGSSSVVSVNYATANDTATASSDFAAIASTPLTFNPGGALTQTITVVVNGDTIDEGASEQFFVNLSGATNATIADGQGVGTITDDDNAPVISINDVTVTEGDSGTVNAVFTVSLSNGSASVVTVNYATANNTAIAPSDYTALALTGLTFNPGAALSQTVTVVVNGDEVDEGASEQFFVNLSTATNATIGDNQGIGTITDDDAPGVIRTAVSTDTILVENPQPAPSQRYIFTVRLDTDPTAATTINLGVSNSQIRIGRPGGPYGTALSLTFLPTGGVPTAPNTLWNVAQTVEVVAVDDLVVETLNQAAQVTFAVQAGSAAEYIGLSIPATNLTVRDNDGADSAAMFNPVTGQGSLLNTLQDLPPAGAYNTYTPGAPISGQWVMGDWNDDGVETPGVYGAGAFYFTNDTGPTSNWTSIWIGLVGRPAVAGRFDAAYGNDCIGAVDSANFPPYGTAFALYFTCNLTSGPTPTLTYQWLSVVLPDSSGYTGAHQFAAGDFNADGVDSFAIRRGEVIAYTNVPPTTVLSEFNLAQYFGNPGASGGDLVSGQYGNLVSGDWNANGVDTFGLFYPAGVLYYRNDQDWNSGVYVRQRMAQPVGAMVSAVTWHPVGGAAMSGASGTATVQGADPTPAPTKTFRRQYIESDDAEVTRTGHWTVQAAPAASGGRYVYSTASTDDALTLEFEGTSVEVFYLEGQSLGTFTIVIDEVAVRTVVTTQGETTFDASTLINYLDGGVHTLQIVPVSGVVAIDAFLINGQ